MNLLLIDLSSLAYPIWHQNQTGTDKTATVTQTLARIRALASGHPHAAICCDSKRSLRREADPTYKAQRPERDANLIHQIGVIQDACRADGFPVWTCDGFEADDVIASAVAWARGVDPATAITIASADKDLLQLVCDPHVAVFRTHSSERFDEGRTLIEFGVRPAQMTDYLTLVGDASDNIKGAEKIGPKTAAKLLSEFGSLEGIYTALTNQGTRFTPATATSLRNFEPRVDAVRNLVRLRTDAVCPFDEVAAERVPVATAASTAPAFAPIEEMEEETMFHDPDQQPDQATPPPQTAAGFDAAAQAIANAAPPVQTFVPPTQPQQPFAQSPTPARPADTNGHGARVVTGTLVPFERQLEPINFPQARALAGDLFESRLFSAYGTPQAVLSTVLAGRELGLQAMASLRAFHIIDGKPSMASDAMRALVLKSGKAKVFRCTERSATRCTYIGQRAGDEGEPLTLTYTIEEAKAAWTKGEDAWNKSNWGKSPADMLVARCSSKLARLIWPDITFGMYAPEELEASL